MTWGLTQFVKSHDSEMKKSIAALVTHANECEKIERQDDAMKQKCWWLFALMGSDMRCYEAGIDAGASRSSIIGALNYAIQHRVMPIVERITLEHDPRELDFNVWKVLENGDVELFGLALERGMRLDVTLNAQTPIFAATWRKQWDIVKLLIARPDCYEPSELQLVLEDAGLTVDEINELF